MKEASQTQSESPEGVRDDLARVKRLTERPRKLENETNPENKRSENERELKAKKRRLIFNQVILIFTIGCIFGTYYEQILTLWKTFLNTGTPQWLSRRGLVYGPLSPVYGIGAVLFYLLFYRTKASRSSCLIIGALMGGMLEYALSLLQEWIFQTRSWNYEGRFLNINGRTTIPYMIFWGILIYVACYIIFPWFDKIYAKLEGKMMNLCCIALAVFLCFDIGMSFAATLRQTERRAGILPDNQIEVFFDEHFPDERLRLIYDNAVEVEK